MDMDEPATVTVDEAVYRALLRLALAAGALGNSLHPDPDCHCEMCELARAWQAFAEDPDVSVFIDRKLRRVPRKVRQPSLLMLAGQDRIVNNALTLGYFESLASPDRHLIVYPEAHHTLEFEPDGPPFVDDLLKWLTERAEGPLQSSRPAF